MEAKVAHTLIKFAAARENALRIAGARSGAKATACRKVREIMNMFSNKTEKAQLKAIRQIEPELRLIMPHEKSRYHKQRQRILDLIAKSHD